MKCYYAFDEVANQKVLIPGCMSVAHTDDIDDCTCADWSFSSFEKKRYNELLNERNREISELQNEVIRLNKQLEKLYNRANEKRTR